MTEKDIEYFTVSQVTAQTGVTAAQLKHWDKTGLLVAQRTGDGIANNRKLYVQDDIEKMREILLYRSLGFGLDEIKSLLAAPPEERSELVSQRTNLLKTQFSNIHKQIELSSALEFLTPEALLGELDCDDISSVTEEFDRDENLKMMIRWMRSHTQQDVDSLKNDLNEVLCDFSALPEDTSWEEVELCLLSFCDVWSKPFGWPTVGQMLDFALLFQEMTNDSEGVAPELRKLFDEDTRSTLAEIFYLAWADNALRVLDDILVSMMKELQDNPVLTNDPKVVFNQFGKLLSWYVCEMGARPHLYKGEDPPAHPADLRELTEEVFRLLETIILDAEVGHFLDIEMLFTIEQQSLDFAHALTLAFVDGKMDVWSNGRTVSQFINLWEQWRQTLREYWRLTNSEELEAACKEAEKVTEEQMITLKSRMASDGRDEDEQRAWLIANNTSRLEGAAFERWVEEHYARVFNDPPEPRWVTEEETIAHEKKMRMLAQEMISQQQSVEEAGSEVNE